MFFYTVEIRQELGVGTRPINAYVDNVFLTTINKAPISLSGDFLTVGVGQFNGFSEVDVEYIEWQDLSNPSNNSLWDATSSNHGTGTPILSDTISSNDATGVNMPTDGSAWLDLGGSSIPVIMNSYRQRRA